MENVELRIDPEFRDKIPPLTPDEFEQLRENILEVKEVFEPITVWNGVIVDGHNRWKIVQEHPEIKYRVREMDFPDKWAAFEWMYKNQLGRRNLTEAQRTLLIGKMYEARKNRAGGQTGNKNAEKPLSQNETVVSSDRKKRTDEIIGDEIGVNHSTVSRAYKFAKGVDALREVSPEAADKVLTGEAKVKKQEIMALAESEPDEVEFVAESIVNDLPVVVPKKEGSAPGRNRKNVGAANGNSTEMRELYRMIDEAYAPMIDVDREIVSTIYDLIEEIEINGKNYVNVLRSTLECKADTIKSAEDKKMVFEAIGRIMQEITKVRGEYVK